MGDWLECAYPSNDLMQTSILCIVITCNDWKQWLTLKQFQYPSIEPSSDPREELYWSDTTLISVFASVIRKRLFTNGSDINFNYCMYNNDINYFRKFPKIQSGNASNSSFVWWEMLPIANFSISCCLPDVRIYHFYLLQDYIGCSDWRVSLCCNSIGKLAVIKFGPDET